MLTRSRSAELGDECRARAGPVHADRVDTVIPLEPTYRRLRDRTEVPRYLRGVAEARECRLQSRDVSRPRAERERSLRDVHRRTENAANAAPQQSHVTRPVPLRSRVGV